MWRRCEPHQNRTRIITPEPERSRSSASVSDHATSRPLTPRRMHREDTLEEITPSGSTSRLGSDACLVRCWTIPRHESIFFLMYDFTRLEEEPEPQTSGWRFGPPRKITTAGLLDPPQFPSIRPRCFGCSQRLEVDEIGRHILSCDRVLAQDLARFHTALAEFEANPSRAREVVEGFVYRVRLNRHFDVGDQSL